MNSNSRVTDVKVFARSFSFARHPVIPINSVMKNFTCQKCQRGFSLARTLYAHFRIHMQNEFACSACFAEFSSKEQFDIHRDSAKLTCKAAKAIIKTSINQQKKDEELTNKLRSLIDEFEIVLKNSEDMVRFGKRNRLNLRARYKIKCPECQLNLYNTVQATEHFHVAHGIQLYPCPVDDCNRVFNCERHLRYHQSKRHREERKQEEHRQQKEKSPLHRRSEHVKVFSIE